MRSKLLLAELGVPKPTDRRPLRGPGDSAVRILSVGDPYRGPGDPAVRVLSVGGPCDLFEQVGGGV